MKAVCKFTCDHVSEPPPEAGGERAVYLTTQYDPDDADDSRFSVLTPWGSMEFGLSNPVLDGFFVPGKSYRITIEPA